MSKRKLSVRQQRIQLEESLRLKSLQRSQKLLESVDEVWLGSYVDMLNRYRDGNSLLYPISGPQDRRYGANYPFWTSENQLSMIRAQARLLVAMNSSAFGLVNGLTSYVIGCGYNYQAEEVPGVPRDDGLVRAVQSVIDNFIEVNAWEEMQQELFFRSREDGESFLRIFPQYDGELLIRTVEPEQVIQKPGTEQREWSFGVQTDPDDVFTILNYWILDQAPMGNESDNGIGGEEVPAEEVVHIKCNVKRAIKRGLTDFSFETADLLTQAGKLRRNMGEGAAVQAAIAAIRQHDTATAAQVETFVQSMIDYSTNTVMGGRQQDYQKMDAGSFLDIPKGMNYVPPPGAGNATSYLAVLQGLLRSAGNRHNAPEWLSSGDASNNNYASSLTAESPFLRNCVRLQAFYKRPYLRVVTEAVKTAIKAGLLPWDTLQKVKITATPPSVETRDKAQEANENVQYVNAGIRSRQTVSKKIGDDWETEKRNMQEYTEEMGPPLPELPTTSQATAEEIAEAIKRDKDGKFSSNGGGGGKSKKSGVGKAVAKASKQMDKATAARKKADAATEKHAKVKADLDKMKADYKAKWGKDYKPGQKATGKKASPGEPKAKAKPEPKKAEKAAPKKSPAKKPAEKKAPEKKAPAKKAPAKKPEPKKAAPKAQAKPQAKPQAKSKPKMPAGGKAGKPTLMQRVKAAIGAGAKKVGKALAGSKLGREIKAAAKDVKRDYRYAKMKVKAAVKKVRGK